MLSFLGTILSILTPIVVSLIKLFVQNQAKKQEMLKSYYNFIGSLDKKAASKVANYLKTEDALKELQNHIREREEMEPDRPTDENPGRVDVKPRYKVPAILEVEAHVKTHGKYLTHSGQAKGLVVHFTAGHFNKGRVSAESTLRYLASKGLGCLVMDTSGAIYRASTQRMNDIAYHAGDSSWRGKDGVSRYCMGMEICNAGKLTPGPEGGLSWFKFQIPKGQCRAVAKKDNMVQGTYHMYTPEQEASLLNL